MRDINAEKAGVIVLTNLAYFFVLLPLANPVAHYIHSKSHYLAAKLLLGIDDDSVKKLATPQQQDWGCGRQFKDISKLPLIGQLFSESMAKALVHAAGPLASSLVPVVVSKLTDSLLLSYLSYSQSLVPLFLLRSEIFKIWTANGIDCGDRDYCHVWQEGGFVPTAALTVVNIASTVSIFFRFAKITRDIQLGVA